MKFLKEYYYDRGIYYATTDLITTSVSLPEILSIQPEISVVTQFKCKSIIHSQKSLTTLDNQINFCEDSTSSIFR